MYDTTRYAVTIDIPAGRSWGYTFDNINEASDAFGEAWRGSHPEGTIVTLWEAEYVIDRQTVER